MKTPIITDRTTSCRSCGIYLFPTEDRYMIDDSSYCVPCGKTTAAYLHGTKSPTEWKSIQFVKGKQIPKNNNENAGPWY